MNLEKQNETVIFTEKYMCHSDSRITRGRVEDWRGDPLGDLLSVSGVSSFVPG